MPTAARICDVFKHATCASLLAAASVNAIVWFPPDVGIAVVET